MQGDSSFGEWLRRRRKMLDLTRRELAQRIGCAAVTIEKMESNERKPSKQMAELFAEHLGVSAEARPAFVRFARMEPGSHRPTASSDTAYRISWEFSHPRPVNLPEQPIPLIGRDRHVAAVRKRVVDDGARLVTLLGPPGVGKTRLAIQSAADMADYFGDGVCFVPLAPIGDPNLVAAALARSLSVNETADQSFESRLKEYLRDKHMLLVLDNFEQVTQAAHLVSELLAECPWLSIIATSRSPLRVHRERQFPVPPLALPPETDSSVEPDSLLRYSAIALFVERAQAVVPDFALTAENAAAVAGVCARLDGLPLAIELVAARVNVLPPQALLERLGGSLMLRSDGPADAPERHRTLHAAIDWSYTLLTTDEQILLARLGVFVGGCSLEAVERVAGCPGDLPPASVLQALASLVNSNLLLQRERCGEPRFALLETIREYALECLAARGEMDNIRQHHAAYYLALAEEADPYLRTAAQQPWLDRLDMERDNFRAALDWFMQRRANAEAGLRLAVALGFFWAVRGHVSEGRHWLARALHDGSDAPPALRALALCWAGSLAWPSDLPAARALLQESVALYRACGCSQQWGLPMALTALALVMAYYADADAVERASVEALELFRQAGDKWGTALALSVLGEAHLLRHDYSGACSRFEESLTLFRETGDKWGIGIPLSNWGYTESLMGNLDQARIRLEAGIAQHREVGERVMRALFLSILAQVVQQQGDYERAAELYGESLDLFRRMGLESNAADVLYSLAYVAQSQGHGQLAGRLYEETLVLFSKLGDAEGIGKCRSRLAEMAASKG
jgi:predicted ATPase/transcriptional regulator with XRE-family HTH domain